MAASQQVGRIFKKIIKDLNDTVTDKKLKQLGEFAITQIVKRTRLGYGVKRSGTPRTKLKPLSDGYVEFRRENRGRLSRLTRPGKSNLTLTGQMLDSMKVTKARFGVATIAPTGRRSGGKDFGGGLRNTTVALQNEKNGRYFNFLSNLEVKKVKRFYERELRKRLK